MPELKRIADPAKREEAARAIGEFLVEQTLDSLADVRSPVAGGKYKRTLSPAYAKIKKAETGSTDANLDLSGQMISGLDAEVDDDLIEYGVFGDRAPIADGHNNFSGESTLPRRQFLPEVGQLLRPDIRDGVQQIVNDALAEGGTVDLDGLQMVRNKTDLYAFLKEQLGLAGTREEIKNVVVRNRPLMRLLADEELDDLL